MPTKTQQQVVDELDNNILLLASAGTGKTDTLAYRVANIINSGRAKPEEILCLTFTNKACREMQERIVLRAQSNKTVVKTVHSFCFDIVRQESKRNTDLFRDFIIFDEEDVRELLKNKDIKDYRLLLNFVGEMKLATVEDGIGTYADALKYLDGSGKLTKLCSDWNGTIHYGDYEYLLTNGAGMVTEYDRKLHDAHGLDFNDLIVIAHKLFADEKIAERWRKSFKYICIDEMQDTSPAEYRILRKLFRGSNVLLCGDYFQTIYGWRGSEPEAIMSSFKSECSPREIIFYENFRSTRTLLKAANSTLKNLFPGKAEEIYPDSILCQSQESGEKIRFKPAASVYEEAAWIYSNIEAAGTGDLSRVCILCRANYYAKQLSNCMARINQAKQSPISFMLVDEFKFFRRQEVKDVLAFMKVLLNRHDVTSLTRIVQHYVRNVGAETLKKIDSEEYRRAGIRLTDYVDESSLLYGNPYQILLDGLKQNNVVVFDVESTGTDTTEDEIVQIAAIRLDAAGNITDKFMRYIRPGRSVGTSELVHHFSDEFLAENGEDAAAVFDAFREFSRDSVVVGHNVNYDISILTSQLQRLGQPAMEYRYYYDTLDIFRRFHPNLRNHKLEYLGEEFKVQHKASHDAFDDICATAEILMYAVKNDIRPIIDTCRSFIGKFVEFFRPLAGFLKKLRDSLSSLRPSDIISYIVKNAGIKARYEKDTQRMDNLRDMYRLSQALDDKKKSSGDAAQEFLKYAALSNTELELITQANPKVPIITVHQAKGCEFDYVFLAGMAEGIFPAKMSEEEGRLFYVAVTRAKKQLFLSCAKRDGYNREREQSRLIRAIDRACIEYA